MQSFAEPVDLGGGDEPAQHGDELVAAEPGHQVVATDGAPQPIGDDLQRGVPGRVAERVVDALEVIQIDEKDCAQGIFIVRVQRLGYLAQHMRTVRQAGQLVMVGPMGEPLAPHALSGDVGERHQ